MVNGGEFNGTTYISDPTLNAIITADITCNDDKWIPIGDGSESGNAQIKYIGTFDGCGHTITGLSCSIDKSNPTESQSVYVGLFGCIGQGGVVKNIGIVNPKISADAISSNDESAQNTDVFVGAIAGLNDGKIQQCYLSGNGTVGAIGVSPCVKNLNVNVGALAGKNAGTIQDCYNCGSTAIKADFKLSDDYNRTYIVASKNEINAGGIVGYNSGSIKNCYNCSAGKITATQSKRVVFVKESQKKVYNREVLQSYAGALAGSVSDGSAVENCYYDFGRCSLDSAVGNKEFAECKLTTEEMTKGTYITEDSKTYVENMPGFLSAIWLVKGSESGQYFYPHLKGFAYDTETTTDNWPSKVSELESRNPGGDKAALCALTISSNKQVTNSDDAGVSITDAGKVKIGGIKAGTELILMNLNDTIGAGGFIGWYSNGNLVTDSSTYEYIISEDVELEIRYRDENDRIIKFVADLNGEKQIWEIVTYTTNGDISFPEMNFYGFKLDGWKVNGDANNAGGTLYTTEEAMNKVAYALGETTTFIVEGVFSRTKEAENSGIPGLNGKYTVTVCWNDVVIERLFRDFATSEYFTFNADEIERYVDTTGKTFSYWLLDDVKISANREVTFLVAKDCVLNAVYVSDQSSSIKLTKVNIDNANNMKLEAEVNCDNSDIINRVTFRSQVAAKVITGKKDDRSYAYTATISNIDVNEKYTIHIQPVVIFNDGSESKKCEEVAVEVDGGMIVSPTSCFQYDEASLITEMNVSIDKGNMLLTTAINSESVAKVLKVMFRYRISMETKELAGTKDDVTGKYTATISDIDVDKVYSIQPVVTINGESVEGTCVEVLPKNGYDDSEKACVAIVDMKTNGSGVVFAEHIFVPAGCIISRVGVLISIGSDKVSNASVLDTVTDEDKKIYNETIQALSGKKVDERGLTCTHTWTKGKIGRDAKVYVLAYLVYFDEFNKQHIVCGIDRNRIGDGGELTPAPALKSIEITTPPSTTAYTAGQRFDPAGMVVTATYSNNSTAEVKGYTPSPSGALATTDTSVTISYTEDGVTKTATQAITVSAAVTKTLNSIAITTAPATTAYTTGQRFDPAGMVVTATYSDNSTAEVKAYTVSPSGALATTDTSVTISYTEDGVTKTATQAITVNPIISTYSITFDANGHGTAPAAQTVESGKAAQKPGDPTASGWTFGGWYTEATCANAFDFSKAITGDITLYAKWTEDKAPEEIGYIVTIGDNGSVTQGNDITITVKRSVDDSTCFSHFTGVEIDGKACAAGDYDARAGSTIVTLKAATIESLSTGTHTISFIFDDGKVETKLTVEKPLSTDISGGEPSTSAEVSTVTPGISGGESSTSAEVSTVTPGISGGESSASAEISTVTPVSSGADVSPTTGDALTDMFYILLILSAFCLCGAVVIRKKCRTIYF